MVALEQAALGDRVVRLVQVDDRARHFAVLVLRHGLERRRDREAVEAVRAEHVEHQHALLRDHRATGLGHDRRMRDVLLVADRHDLVDHVGRVLLQRVVRRELEVGLASVVVDAETAADVEVAHARAHLGELGVDARELIDARADLANVVDLRAHVAVQELEAVLHAAALEVVEHLDHLGEREAELGLHARAVTPAARARGRQVHAHADLGTDLILVGVLHDEPQLGEVLDHGDDRAAELGGERDELDVAVFLEAVADDQALGRIAGEAHHRKQLGLGADLETEAVLLAVLADFLDHAALLVDLDRVDRVVLALVAVLLDRGVEGLVEVLEPAMEQIAEVQQHRRAQATLAQALHDLEEIDLTARRARRAHEHGAGLGHLEEALAPTTEVVDIGGVVDGPRIDASLHAGHRRSGVRAGNSRSHRRKNLRHRSPQPSFRSRHGLDLRNGSVRSARQSREVGDYKTFPAETRRQTCWKSTQRKGSIRRKDFGYWRSALPRAAFDGVHRRPRPAQV